MNLNELFPTDKDRNKALDNMKGLSLNANWRFLSEKILEPEIEQISNEILENDIEDIAKLNDLKRRRAYWIILSQVPDKIIKALENSEPDIIDFDPYPKKG